MLTVHSLHLWLARPAGPLRQAIEAALAPHGTPLRWAITVAGDDRLLIEAVLVREDGERAGASRLVGDADGGRTGRS